MGNEALLPQEVDAAKGGATLQATAGGRLLARRQDADRGRVGPGHGPRQAREPGARTDSPKHGGARSMLGRPAWSGLQGADRRARAQQSPANPHGATGVSRARSPRPSAAAPGRLLGGPYCGRARAGDGALRG
eukprot:2944827-Alexandrium_andersonii.AAC.1